MFHCWLYCFIQLSFLLFLFGRTRQLITTATQKWNVGCWFRSSATERTREQYSDYVYNITCAKNTCEPTKAKNCRTLTREVTCAWVSVFCLFGFCCCCCWFGGGGVCLLVCLFYLFVCLSIHLYNYYLPVQLAILGQLAIYSFIYSFVYPCIYFLVIHLLFVYLIEWDSCNQGQELLFY